MKKIWILPILALLFLLSRFGTESVLGLLAECGGFETACSFVTSPRWQSYEGDLTVCTGYTITGQHVQIARRGETVTVGCPYIEEGY